MGVSKDNYYDDVMCMLGHSLDNQKVKILPLNWFDKEFMWCNTGSQAPSIQKEGNFWVLRREELRFEKESNKFGFRAPYTTGFTPKTQEHIEEFLTAEVYI